jgi:hypothetical protein
MAWDVLEIFCYPDNGDVTYKPNSSPDAVSPSAEHKETNEVHSGGASVVSTSLLDC